MQQLVQKCGSSVLVAAVCLLPACALALSAQAGIAAGGLWISRTTLAAGDTARIYTVLYNSSADTVAGDAHFLMDDAPIGTVHFSLASGESQIESVPWTAAQGAHTLRAHLSNISGVQETPDVAHTETQTLSVSVTPPAPPTPTQQAVQQITNAANYAGTTAAPAISQAVSTVASTTENFRTQSAKSLAAALTDVQKKAAASHKATAQKSASARPLAHKGEVLGTSTTNFAAIGNVSATDWWNMVCVAVLSVLVAIFSKAAFFYPFFFILGFILFVYARRKLLRPNYEY